MILLVGPAEISPLLSVAANSPLSWLMNKKSPRISPHFRITVLPIPGCPMPDFDFVELPDGGRGRDKMDERLDLLVLDRRRPKEWIRYSITRRVRWPRIISQSHRRPGLLQVRPHSRTNESNSSSHRRFGTLTVRLSCGTRKPARQNASK
jgi:hypothetical protein